jgi:hypothetical protein
MATQCCGAAKLNVNWGQAAEEIRVTVQTRSATGSYAGIQVAGTINLFNYLRIVHRGEHPPVPFTAQIQLKPTK